MALDWDEIGRQGAPGADITTIKAELPIAYVLTQADIGIEQTPDGKLHSLCPFHDDSSPSFDVYGDNLERWNCPVCALDGDVLDLIQKLPYYEASTLGEALGVARQLLAEMDANGWAGFKPVPREPFDVETAKRIINDSYDDLNELERFIAHKDYPFTSEWLVEWFQVGSYGSWAAVAPYYTSAGELVGYKHRTLDEKFISAANSNFHGMFYNEASDDGKKPILLCESESDVWVAQFKLGDKYTVLGLPTGAGSKPESKRDQDAKTRAERLAGRKVVVAFDGDGDALSGKAGRGANLRWYTSLTVQGCDVRIVPMPDDYDVASVPNLEELVENARPILDPPKDIRFDAAWNGYVRYTGKDKLDVLSNWVFLPDRELHGEIGTAYEGIIKPSNRRTVLSSDDLTSKGSLIKWSKRHEQAFFGSDRDAQQILGLLQHRGPFLATGKMTAVAGLHENQFIFPGGKIGADYWVYVRPIAGINLEKKIKMTPHTGDGGVGGNNTKTATGGNWRPEQLLVMRKLHQTGVMDPLLAFLAMAPLRSMLPEFPILAITGSAGTGKTTLFETILPVFTGSLISTNLTDTTKHALTAYLTSTNAWPVWLDEYRREIRKDTMPAIKQSFRDAYNGHGSAKAGSDPNNVMTVDDFPLQAPIIVTGEDAFHESSHTERMIMINLPLQGKNPKVKDQIKKWGDTGWAHEFYSWIQASLIAGTLPRLEVEPWGPEDLPDRTRYNLGVIQLGWKILIQYLEEHGINAEKAGFIEPNMDFVIKEAREAAATNPTKDAIRWAIDQGNAWQFAKFDETAGMVYLRVDEFVYQVEKFSTYTLPGGVKAVEKFIQAHYDAERMIHDMGGQKKRVWAFSAEIMDMEDEDD